jgi:hypothetical protein
MAKDPAFLFYTSDFLTGTLTMTDEQVGKYIRLLCLQHQKGELSEKDMLFICKSHDEDIFSKFKNIDGKYFNERLKEESIKRIKYSESRRNNKLKKNISSSYVKHMENENENENENINKDENKSFIKNGGQVGSQEGGQDSLLQVKTKTFKPPSLEEVVAFFETNGYTNADKAWNYYNDGDWKDSKGNPVVNWKQKMRMVWFKDENKPKMDEHEKIAAANRAKWQRERERFEQLNK